MGWLLLLMFFMEEPSWEMYPAVKQVNDPRLGKILTDIESRMPNGHPYRNDQNLVNWNHESVHGINSYARMKFQEKYAGKRINCFYCLWGRVAVIEEPQLTLGQIATYIPGSFRGMLFKTYFIDARKDWENYPLYCLDEWSAYSSGTETYRELGLKDKEATIEFTFEFMNYSLFLLKCVKENRPDYDDKQLKAFIRWNIERCIRLYQGEVGAKKYLDLLRNHEDGTSLRNFIKSYYGVEWYEKTIVREMFW